MATAVILAGGLGTRLVSLVPHLPKALAPIQGTPFLDILLRQMEESKMFAKVVLALGHKAENIEQFVKESSYSFAIELSIERSLLGTGGAILQALPFVDDECFLVLNGDTYCNVSFPSFLQFHQEKKAALSIACREVKDAERYGTVKMDSAQRIIGFEEKSAKVKAGWISTGVYWMQRSLFTGIQPGVYSLERDFFPQFLNRPVFAYCNTGAFIDIGTPVSYLDAQEILKSKVLA